MCTSRDWPLTLYIVANIKQNNTDNSITYGPKEHTKRWKAVCINLIILLRWIAYLKKHECNDGTRAQCNFVKFNVLNQNMKYKTYLILLENDYSNWHDKILQLKSQTRMLIRSTQFISTCAICKTRYIMTSFSRYDRHTPHKCGQCLRHYLLNWNTKKDKLKFKKTTSSNT